MAKSGVAGNRSHNAKSSLAMMSNFDGINDPNNSIMAQEKDSVAKKVAAEEALKKMATVKVSSQVEGGGSSIAASDVTETVMTAKSEHLMNYGQQAANIDGGLNANDSDLHEDTIDAWKIQSTAERKGKNYIGTQNASQNERETPELTDENGTYIDRHSQIGDGPIFIKKSTDCHNTANRRLKLMGSQSSLDKTESGAAVMTQPRKHLKTMIIRDSASVIQNHQDFSQRGEPRPVSDMTVATDLVVRNEEHIHANKQIRVASKVSNKLPQTASGYKNKKPRDSLAQSSIAHKSAHFVYQNPSSFSVEGDAMS